MLTKLEKLGLRISAYVRVGALPSIDCELCKEEGKQDQRNCDGDDREEATFSHPDIGELTACPLLYVSPAIVSFVDRYKFIEKFPHTMTNYEDTTPRLWEFIQYYDDCRAEALLCIKKGGGGEDTEKAINSIKNRWKK